MPARNTVVTHFQDTDLHPSLSLLRVARRGSCRHTDFPGIGASIAFPRA